LFNPQRWKVGITSTVFWAGEPGNMRNAFDSNWIQNVRYQNSFYIALPYSDIDNHHTRPEARCVIPWFSRSFIRDGQSVCKDRWVEIRKGNRIVFAQWEDVGPFQTDHWQYVFGNERPRPNRNQDAGIDVSSAVQQFLGLNGIDAVDWRFVNSPPPGPWLSFNNQLARK